jgi:four helix bundle protein
MEAKKFIPLKELKVYQLARLLSNKAWVIYSRMKFEEKKIIGDQFITSTDSVGANISEGYVRFHFLDKVKFYYNSRGSLMESFEHWLELLKERKMISVSNMKNFILLPKNFRLN